MSRLFSSLQRLEITSAVVTAYPYTMACWAYDDGTSTSFPFLMNCSTSGTTAQATRIPFYIDNTGKIGTINDTVTSSARSTNTWFHACAVEASATSHAAFLNGGSKGTKTTSFTFPTGMNRTTINAWNGGSNVGIAGNIAHPAIWNVALTDAEVAMLASGLSPLRVRPQSLIFYLPTLGRDSPEIDIIGAQTLTVHGATASSNEPPFIWPQPAQ
jgi:hypothetical protein